ESISLGADKAILLSDRAFAGADTLATGYTLARAIQRFAQAGPVDLIMCGKQAVDGDTAQVGPGIATRLGYTQFTYVTEVKAIDIAKRYITVKRRVEGGIEVIRGPLPAVLTAELDLAKPRRGSLPQLIHSLRTDITLWNADAIEGDPSKLGLKGSPTWVKRIFSPPHKEGGPVFDAERDPRQAVDSALNLLFADEAFAIKFLKH
ncbi:MAG: electron transfer flavoprotein subunit beta/FixA family protein, partial [Syntrophorhabdaceae bacterium]